MILAAMLGVSAMAVQNVLVQVSLKEAPSTAVMTTNLTRFVADLVEVWFGRDQGGRAKAVARAGRTGIAIAGFVIGACLGAWCQARLGLWSLAMPTGLALAALAIACWSDGFVQATDRARHRCGARLSDMPTSASIAAGTDKSTHFNQINCGWFR
jgi:uncharacterized membrane protein YoaK (UPF0700 family)